MKIPRQAYLAAGMFMTVMFMLTLAVWFHIEIEPLAIFVRGETQAGERLSETVYMPGVYFHMVVDPIAAAVCLYGGVKQ